MNTDNHKRVNRASRRLNIGKVEVTLHAFLTSVPDGVGGQLHAPDVLPRGKSHPNPSYALHRRICNPRVGLEAVE